MAKQAINVGTTANDKKGDSLRAAFQKVNSNFTELYEAVGLAATGQDTALTFIGSTLSTDDSSAITIDQAATITSNLSVGGDLLPQTANGGDLGSSTLPWRSLYVSNNTIYIGGTAVGLDANGALTTGGTVVGSTPAWANITGKPTIPTSFDRLVNDTKTLSLGSNGTLTLPSQPNLLTNVNQIFTTKIYKDAKTPTPTPAEITTAYDYWLGEQEFYNAIRNEDASSIAPTTRSWAGLPPWEAYPLIVGFTGPGLPPPNSLATAAQSAINAYLSWKELVSNLEIVNGNQTISFENTGNLILPSTVSMNGKLSLGPTLGGIHANQSTGIISIGDYIDADTGYGLAPSTTIAIGGAANVFQISTYGPPAKTWTFGKDGNLQIPGNLQISGDIRSEREINIDINLSDSTLRRWQFGEDGGLTFPDGYLKIVPNGANPYISNRIDNGFGLVSGSAIQIRQSIADAYGISINSSTTDTSLGGGASLAGGSNIDVNGSKIILAKYTSNYLDADTGLTGQNKIEINDNSILIGLDVLTVTSGTTTSAFSGWTFDGQADTLTFPDNTVQSTAWTGIANALRSETGIYIDVNLSDSTLRRWQFGEDGSLTLPSVGKINNGEYDWTFGSTGNTTFPTGLTLSAARGPNTVNFTSGIDKEFQIETQTNTTGRLWNFGTDGALTIPGDIKSNGNINIDINLTDSTLRRWQFGEDGYLTLPNDRGINSSTNIKIELPNSIPSGITNLNSNGGWNQGSYNNLATTGGTGTGLTVNAASQASNGYLDTIAINTAGSGYTNGDVITITNENFLTATFTVTVPAANTWTFGENGRTTFPNGAVPVHSYGVAGDKEGMVAFDDTYIYYCTADYVNNISDIWKRVAWSGSTW